MSTVNSCGNALVLNDNPCGITIRDLGEKNEQHIPISNTSLACADLEGDEDIGMIPGREGELFQASRAPLNSNFPLIRRLFGFL
jgi:hypothetical protein